MIHLPTLAIFVVLLALVSVGCGRRPAESPQAAPAPIPPSSPPLPAGPQRAYLCADGFPFLVQIEGETAHVTLPDRSVALPLMPAASGSKYDDGEVLFWSQGPTALISADGELHRDCQPGPPQQR
ncbi:MAG TPA: MliC family protein [Thermoanaerobaculia bacterium]|nr:MliC family protein [Thermoanaerobaculia bacterium]